MKRLGSVKSMGHKINGKSTKDQWGQTEVTRISRTLVIVDNTSRGVYGLPQTEVVNLLFNHHAASNTDAIK